MLGIVSHDAGGAEVLSSYILREKLKCHFTLEGPAKHIFKKKLGKIAIGSLDETMDKCTHLICGTSWQSDLEWRAIQKAKIRGIPVCAFVDHWCNYKERFIRNDKLFLPDEIWVGDIIAYKKARKNFKGTSVKLVENPYIAEIKEKIFLLESDNQGKKCRDGLTILYVCEPISEHALFQYNDPLFWGYTEIDALQYFFRNLHKLDSFVEKIIIRPHPSEKSDKYYRFIDTSSDKVILSDGADLIEEIAISDVVVGCSSMAMVIGLHAGRRVISSIPPYGKSGKLPQPEIEYLSDF